MGIADQLSTHFQGGSKKDWQTVAKSETDQTNPLDSLAWSTADQLQFAPYYDLLDVIALDYLQKFDFQDASIGHLSPREWQNLPHITVIDEKKANEQALDHLKHEADGILFSLTKPWVNFQVLLQGIELSYCSVSFFAPDNFSFHPLSEYFLEKKYIQLNGSLFQRSPSLKENSLYEVHGLNSFGVFVHSSSPTDEIAYALTESVRLIDKALEKKIPIERILRAIAFSIPATGDFLLTISKVKALRLLWFQVTQAYHVKSYSPADLHIHTRAEVWTDEKFQPHGNMIKSTIATMAAVAGGCTSHSVYAEQENENMSTRIARNNSLILKEESHFGKVADPLAGSYVIENMVHEIAKSAWTKFQNQL